MKTRYAREIARTWPVTWFGFADCEPAITGHPYTDDDHIDPDWKPEDLSAIVRYLRRAPAVVGQMPPERCRLCGEMLTPATFHFDEKWLWPDTLAHNVACHDFVLPDDLVMRIRAHAYQPPLDAFGPEAMLPWPT